MKAAEGRAARTPDELAWLTIRGAAQNNLKNVDVSFPLGRFTCVTGVSGSGKSSLVNDILHDALARQLNGAETVPGRHAGIDGVEHLDKIIAIDQTPIGRTPRSNPATYIKLFDEIRDLFTKLPDAKLRGYKPGRFSFNVAAGLRGGGRCEACEGNGANRIEMDFLADVWVTCPVCEGKRFSRETLQVRYGEHREGSNGGTQHTGYSIADVLEMDVQQALTVFENQPRIRWMLQTLHDVGLDYIKIGQPSPTLSGGEAQRIKLARELVKKPTGRTLYVLDEPTTGLHFEDIRKLLSVLHGFVDAGNTVVVIEHNTDVIKTADWIIDLGPEGGAGGGRIIAEGTPEEVAECEESYTGRSLRDVLSQKSEARSQKSAHAMARRDDGRDKLASDFLLRTSDLVTVSGARQHNLKDITVQFPRDRMTVCTGVSGSGKTSFAIDTVFTEGYRRYVESLSAYARQFLGQLAKPRVDHVEGLSPAICIEQKAASKSPRSTVGTITEIYDYMRVLWARLGTRYCPKCETPIGTQTVDEIVARVMAFDPGSPIIILAPIGLGDGETYASLFNRLKASGYARVRIDGQISETAQATTLDARTKHRVEVVIDRTVVRAKSRARINESIEHALALGNGVMTLVVEAVERHDEENAETAPAAGQSESDKPQSTGNPQSAIPNPQSRVSPQRVILFSQKLACTKCGTSYEELSPHHYSFNSQMGWCETCEGLGVQRGAPAGSIITDPNKSILSGAIAGWWRIEPHSPFGRVLAALCRRLGVNIHTPLGKWTAEQRQALLYGTSGDWIDPNEPRSPEDAKRRGQAARTTPGAADDLSAFRFHWRGFFPAIDAATRNSWSLRHRLHNVVTDIPCVACRGGRLRPDAAATRLVAGSELRVASSELNRARPDEAQFATLNSQLATSPEAQFATPDSQLATPSLVEICQWPLARVAAYFAGLKLDARQQRIAGELIHELRNRLQFLIDVGLDYLTLHRAAPTLSGGEAQRIRLASQIGSGLSGVLYVLDEPTIGLHPRDTKRLVEALLKLRDLGNTLLLVEHDREVIASADRLLDFGPRAGRDGGRIVAEGPPGGMQKSEVGSQKSEANAGGAESLTRGYLAGDLAIPVPTNRRPVRLDEARELAAEQPSAAVRRASKRGYARHMLYALGGGLSAFGGQGSRRGREAPDMPPSWLVVRGARQNNLKDLRVPIPLGRLVCVTGVSGSGKSSLVNDILWPALANEHNRANLTPGEHEAIDYWEGSARGAAAAALRLDYSPLDKVINVDQSPIGLTPASNPATYTGAFDWIRELFARLPDSKLRGYQANRFSFNRPGGRCEACEGNGQRRIEMHFMPDVWVECETCKGKRYEPETLSVTFKGKSIADVLDMRVGEALTLFDSVPKVRRLLQTLADVGLDYVQLGQPAPTLSGGEAQRVKLAAELGKPDTGNTLYILDEPTTGLHFDDVRKLLNVLHRLVDLGNTVIVVEHNLDVLKNADWVIDLGPEAGEAGGRIVAMGTPEEIAKAEGRSQKAEVGRGQGRSGTSTSDFLLLASDLTSHTARALAPVLAAGPYATRAVYDVHEHLRQQTAVERAGLGRIGKEIKQPWQLDGRRWHLEQRDSRGGKTRRWKPEALEFAIELVEEHGRLCLQDSARKNGKRAAAAQLETPFSLFEPTNWNDRASIEITAAGASTWFLHALTGGEWLFELYFRAPPGTFEAAALNRQLGLKTLDQRPDIESYGDWPRVDVRPRLDGLDAVAVYVHDKAEIDTAAFRDFVKQAVAAYARAIGRSKETRS